VSKPYWSGPGAGEDSRFPGNSPGDSPARSNREHSYTGGHESRYQPRGGESYGSGYTSRRQTATGYPTYDSGYHGGYGGYGRSGTGTYQSTGTYEPEGDNYEYYPDDGDDRDDGDDLDRPDTRWRWVAGLAAMVLLVALIAIGVATRGGESSSNSTTAPTTPSGEPALQDAITTTAPRTVIATAPPPPALPPADAALTPETVVTVTPTPPAATAAPSEAPPAPPAAAAPGQTLTYTVTGTRQLFDLVSIIYTDEQGFPRTDVNVALPWTRTVVLNPGVVTKSLTATSLTGQLNCTVTDGTGATISAQSNNAAITTCTS
jgi:hypothetical protein